MRSPPSPTFSCGTSFFALSSVWEHIPGPLLTPLPFASPSLPCDCTLHSALTFTQARCVAQRGCTGYVQRFRLRACNSRGACDRVLAHLHSGDSRYAAHVRTQQDDEVGAEHAFRRHRWRRLAHCHLASRASQGCEPARVQRQQAECVDGAPQRQVLRFPTLPRSSNTR